MTLALPAGLYSDPEFYERERRTVWWNQWVMVGVASDVVESGSCFVADVAGWSILVARDPSGDLRAFHNVCPHRAGVIAWPGQDRLANLVCRYHGWAFGWDGTLRSARDFGSQEDFCLTNTSLTPVAVATWGPMVFVRLNPDGPSLEASLEPFTARLDAYPVSDFSYGHRLVRKLRCNWKTYVDNYLEGYHVSLLHPALSRALDMGTYRVEVPHDDYCVHLCDTPAGSPSAGAWLFRYPNLAVNIYPEGMNIERIIPVDPGHTRVVYDYFAVDPSPERIRDMIELSNVTLDEDQAICEQVQRNLDSGIYRAGPLSHRHEVALAWFQNRIAGEVV